MRSYIEAQAKSRKTLQVYLLALLITNAVAAFIVFVSVGSGYVETAVINSIGTVIGVHLSLSPALKIYDLLIEAREASIEGYNTDALTGLMSRKPMLDMIQGRLEDWDGLGSRGVILVDIDRFKAVNDTYGHKAGDEIMAQIGLKLKEVLVPGGLLGRFGGEEFLIYIDGKTTEWLSDYAERICGELCATYEFEGRRIDYTASVGIVIDTVCELDLKDLIREADTMMYLAKDKGRNRTEVKVIGRETNQ